MTLGTEERYLSASQSSNLRVQADKQGDADVMIASGWSASRIGAALMRLHTKPTRDNLALVHVQVSMRADKLNIANPDSVASAVIAWWLSRTCPVCHGRKWDTIKDTPSLSAIECPSCHGSGEKPFPAIDGAAEMEAWINKCKHEHVSIIKDRLRPVTQ